MLAFLQVAWGSRLFCMENTQSHLESAETELRLRNYSPKTIKSYRYFLREYLAFRACLPAGRDSFFSLAVDPAEFPLDARSGAPKSRVCRHLLGAPRARSAQGIGLSESRERNPLCRGARASREREASSSGRSGQWAIVHEGRSSKRSGSGGTLVRGSGRPDARQLDRRSTALGFAVLVSLLPVRVPPFKYQKIVTHFGVPLF